MPYVHHTPKLRRHKPSAQGVVTLSGRDHYLGQWPAGQRNAPEPVREVYDRLIAEWLANGRQQVAVARQPAQLMVAELVIAFLKHAEQHYQRADGTQTNEVVEFKMSLRPLVHLYGTTSAADFGPLALKAVRQLLVEGYTHPKYGPQTALSRGVVNHRTGRIRRMFKWAVENEHVPPSVLYGLQAVRGLQRGRTEARETEPVGPADAAVVEATLPYLNRHVAAMVQLQKLTGMRPGEVCAMRARDIDMSGSVWLYQPGSDRGPMGEHKTAHLGRQRIIALGPKCKEIIKPFLTLNMTAHLFCPAIALQEMRAEMRRTRKTKVPRSQQMRRKKQPKWTPGERYRTSAYAYCIRRACQRADRDARAKAIEKGMDQQEAKGRVFVPHWHPNQLRHSHATEVRRRFGLEAAQVALGHSHANVTQVYAERDLSLAVQVAREMG
jgi:integrase